INSCENITNCLGVEGFYAQTVGVDPLDAQRAYFGDRSLFMTTDGGASGVISTNRIDLNIVHADQHALVFSPPTHPNGTGRTQVYNGTDGGLARTKDATYGGGYWDMLNGIG